MHVIHKTTVRALVSVMLIASIVAVVPAAAQDADWLVSSERGTVGISSPAGNDTVSGAVDIAGTATSPAFAYYKVEYSVDGDTWLPVDGDAYMHDEPVTEGDLATWDTTAVNNGRYWLRAVVVDNTGNYVASEPVAVTVDNPEEEEAAIETEEAAAAEVVVAEEVVTQVPAATPSWLVSSERGTVGISSPAGNDTVSGAVDIAGTATSPAFAYYKVEYSVDGDTWLPVDGDAYMHDEPVTEGDLATWDTTAANNGRYWLRAVVVDNTGNYVASEPIAVTVDNPASPG